MAEDDSLDDFSKFTRDSSSSASIRGRRSRGKKIISVSGTVSNILGKDYVSSSNNRIGVRGLNVSPAFEKVQAWNTIPNLSDPRSEDVMATFGTSSSNNNFQEGDISFMGVNRNDALANRGTRPPCGPESCSEDEWKSVVKNESRKQKLDFPSEAIANGDDYQNYRITASQYWDAMSDMKGQAAFARRDGRWDAAKEHDTQARMLEKMAQQADERATQDIFDSRNIGIKNRMKINLREQHLSEGMRILRLHLIFGIYQRSLWQLQVITGYGSHGSRSSVLKQSVVDLLQKENIQWKEENRGSLLITFDKQKRELGFVECEDDDREDVYYNSTYTSSSNASSASSSTGSIDSMSSRRSRRKKVISVSGSVSNITGKEYLSSSSNKKTGVQERNAVEKVQAWEAMPDPSNTSEDVMAVFGTSSMASSSNNDLEGDTSIMGGNSYANFGPHPPSGPENSSEQKNTTVDMSEGFYKRLRDMLQVELDNQKNVDKLHTQKHDYPSPKNQHIPGDDCQNQRITASQYRDSAKVLREKVGFACKNGNLDIAKDYDNQARMFDKMAHQADEKASLDIFDSRNKGFKNRMEIDLHGQRLKEGLSMLKQHLIFGVYRRSLWQLKVITGYGSHGTGPSVLKQSVVHLLQKENLKWQEEEENRGSLLITFDEQQRELSFV